MVVEAVGVCLLDSNHTKFSLERLQIPFRVMAQSRAITIQNREINEPEGILELVFLDDLVEEFRDVGRRIGECTASHGGQAG